MVNEKYLNDVKSLDNKIKKKEEELVELRKKKEQAQAKLFSDLIKTSNLDLDDIVALLGNTDEKEVNTNGRNS